MSFKRMSFGIKLLNKMTANIVRKYFTAFKQFSELSLLYKSDSFELKNSNQMKKV
jgi:hypothetical protein